MIKSYNVFGTDILRQHLRRFSLRHSRDYMDSYAQIKPREPWSARRCLLFNVQYSPFIYVFSHRPYGSVVKIRVRIIIY